MVPRKRSGAPYLPTLPSSVTTRRCVRTYFVRDSGSLRVARICVTRFSGLTHPAGVETHIASHERRVPLRVVRFLRAARFAINFAAVATSLDLHRFRRVSHASGASALSQLDLAMASMRLARRHRPTASPTALNTRAPLFVFPPQRRHTLPTSPCRFDASGVPETSEPIFRGPVTAVPRPPVTSPCAAAPNIRSGFDVPLSTMCRTRRPHIYHFGKYRGIPPWPASCPGSQFKFWPSRDRAVTCVGDIHGSRPSSTRCFFDFLGSDERAIGDAPPAALEKNRSDFWHSRERAAAAPTHCLTHIGDIIAYRRCSAAFDVPSSGTVPGVVFRFLGIPVRPLQGFAAKSSNALLLGDLGVTPTPRFLHAPDPAASRLDRPPGTDSRCIGDSQSLNKFKISAKVGEDTAWGRRTFREGRVRARGVRPTVGEALAVPAKSRRTLLP
ncbi:hypothetical protein B0H15DRAFT_803180 [Mycena belliarum]|uniref:Uncharacterized protein n=1 Tax=Mycena belliarum TaxID=1033014 RepID=A0AAD6TYJ1_9AGAR|nr:hypothetical protein B0H15DRAFT_803180 [Mycena belliae]